MISNPFNQCVQLTSRCLGHFHLDSVNKIYGCFIDPMSTISLDVSSNLLENTNGFIDLYNLQILNLSHNKIREYFRLPSSIKVLDLSHNELSECFAGFQKMLQNNGPRFEISPFFIGLVSIEELNLSHNNITVLPSSVFESNAQIKILNVSHNQLKGAVWSLRKLLFLRQIDISWNQLESMNDLKPLEKLEFIEKLTFTSNPFETRSKDNKEGFYQKIRQLLPNVLEIHCSFGIIQKGCEMIEFKEYSSPRPRSISSKSSIRNSMNSQRSPIVQNSKQAEGEMVTQSPNKWRQKGSRQDEASTSPMTREFNVVYAKERKSKCSDFEGEKISSKPIVSDFQMTPAVRQVEENLLADLLDICDEPLVKTNEMSNRLIVDDASLCTQFMKLNATKEELNRQLKKRKFNLIQLERENGQMRKMIVFLQKIIAQVYILNSENSNVDVEKQIHEIVFSMEMFCESPDGKSEQVKTQYMKEINLKLLRFNNNHFDLSLILQNVDKAQAIAEQLKLQFS